MSSELQSATSKRNLRSLYKSLDSAIDEQVLGSLNNKYGFLNRIFRKPDSPFLDDLQAAIENSKWILEGAKEKAEELGLEHQDLSLILYDRISQKLKKNFNVSQAIIDKSFVEVNSQILKNSYFTDFQSLVPPHLFNLSASEASRDKNLIKKPFKEHLDGLRKLSSSDFTNKKHNLATAVKIQESILHLDSFTIENKIVPPMRPDTRAKEEDKLENLKSEFYQDIQEKHNKNKSFSKKSLTQFEEVGIELLRKQQNSLPLSNKDQKFLTSFVEHVTDDKSFNKRIGRIIKSGRVNPDMKDLYENLHKYSHKTRDIKDIENTTAKLASILDRIDKNLPLQLSKDEKISLKSFGKMARFISENTVFESAQNLSSNSTKLSELISLRAKCKTTFQQFEKKIKEQALTSYKSGDIIVDVAEHSNKFRNRKHLDLTERLKNFITPYSHAGINIQDGSGVVRSHITAKHVIAPSTAEDELISSNFRVYPDKLIHDKKLRAELSKSLGIEENALGDYLQKEYQAIATAMNDKEQFSNVRLDNFVPRIHQAGKADFIPFGHRGKEKVTSWADRVGKKADEHGVGKALRDDSDTQICSEFVAKMTVLVLDKLDKKLVAQMQERDPDFKPPKYGIISMPFSKKENLSKIHPYRLIKMLQDRKAVVPLENSLVKQIVRF